MLRTDCRKNTAGLELTPDASAAPTSSSAAAPLILLGINYQWNYGVVPADDYWPSGMPNFTPQHPEPQVTAVKSETGDVGLVSVEVDLQKRNGLMCYLGSWMRSGQKRQVGTAMMWVRTIPGVSVVWEDVQ